MSLIQNFPFFTIILSMFSGIISFILNGKAAKWLHLLMTAAVLVMSLVTLNWCMVNNVSYTFMMGHFPAPWGNEIRVGTLEALMAVFFALLMLLSVLGGIANLDRDVQDSKKNLFYSMLDLLMASLLALIYTNDLFTAYVFIEICTLTACGLIMIQKSGRNYVSAIRYMIMSQIGSGLFLIGLSMLYSVTGHLLMTPASEALAQLAKSGSFDVPLEVILILMTVGLAVKSGLYPFHTWIPDSYGYTTPTSSAILSSLVSKGYIFLLIKLFYRTLDFNGLENGKLLDILFVLGIVGMIMGSVDAIREDNLRRMTAYSSVAQIGYIFMGIGLGTTAGVEAALFHMVSHGAMKALLFVCIPDLVDVSGGRADRAGLTGAARRNRFAGFAFTVGAMSMVGIPLLTGFVSKYLFAAAATGALRTKMLTAWIALAISTTLNCVYFLRVVLAIYTPAPEKEALAEGAAHSPVERTAMAGLIALNFALGVASPPVVWAIRSGLSMFS